MCDRAALLALAAVLLAGPARAQDRDVLRSRIARLERELRSAEVAAAHADSVAHMRDAPPDTVRVGALRVLAPPGIGGEARAGAARALALIDTAFGTATDALAERRFTLVLQAAQRELRPVPAGTIGVLTTGSTTDIDQRLVWAAAQAMASLNDSALSTWLQGALVPNRHPERERRGVYVALVTAPSPAGQRCYQGDLDACRRSLGLVPVELALDDWYNAARRRSVVQELQDLDAVRAAPRLSSACLTAESDADCLAVLRRVPHSALPPPLPAAARFSLLRSAVELGGRGAYTRLLSTAGRPMETRLAAASGVSSDSLLRTWRAAMFAARPLPVTVGPRAGWVALAWGVVFAFLALRSTRWR